MHFRHSPFPSAGRTARGAITNRCGPVAAFALAFAIAAACHGQGGPTRHLPAPNQYIPAVDVDLKAQLSPLAVPAISLNLVNLFSDDSRYDFIGSNASQWLEKGRFVVYWIDVPCDEFMKANVWPDPFRDPDLEKLLQSVDVSEVKPDAETRGSVTILLSPKTLKANRPLFVAYLAARKDTGVRTALTHASILCFGEPGPDLPEATHNNLKTRPRMEAAVTAGDVTPHDLAGPRYRVSAVDLKPENAVGIQFATRRKVPALKVNIKDYLPKGKPTEDHVSPERFLVFWYVKPQSHAVGDPPKPIPTWSPPDKPFDKLEDRQRLVLLRVRGVEYDPANTGVAYIYYDQTVKPDDEPNLRTISKVSTVPNGDPLYVVYLPKVKEGERQKALVQASPINFSPPQFLTLKSAFSVAAANVQLTPPGGPITLVDVTPQPSLPPTPPLTPPDRPAVSVGAVPITKEKADVFRLKVDDLTLQDVSRYLLPIKNIPGRLDLTLRGQLSTNDRDPDARLEAELTLLRGIRSGIGVPMTGVDPAKRDANSKTRPASFDKPLRYSSLQPDDEGIYFAPRILFTASQPYVFGRGNNHDDRYQVEFAPLRLVARSKGWDEGLLGRYMPRNSTGPDGGSITLELSPVEWSIDHFSRNVQDSSGRLSKLYPRGLLGPRLGASAKVSYPIGRYVSAQQPLPLSLELSTYLKYFYQSRNSVVRDYFLNSGIGVVPFDVPAFPDFAHDIEAAIVFPVDFGLLGKKDAAKVRLGYHFGFPRSQGFYDVFAQKREQFFIELTDK